MFPLDGRLMGIRATTGPGFYYHIPLPRLLGVSSSRLRRGSDWRLFFCLYRTFRCFQPEPLLRRLGPIVELYLNVIIIRTVPPIILVSYLLHYPTILTLLSYVLQVLWLS